jgi:hypothetical protein
MPKEPPSRISLVAASVEIRRTMTFPNFLLALGIGAAMLAFWVVLRFPKRAPDNMPKALIHVGIAFAVGWFVPDMFRMICTYGFSAAITGIFVLVFPVLFYTFLSGAWFLKVATDMIGHYRH